MDRDFETAIIGGRIKMAERKTLSSLPSMNIAKLQLYRATLSESNLKTRRMTLLQLRYKGKKSLIGVEKWSSQD